MNIADKLFSDEYVNKNAAKNNVIIYLLGRFSYPFSVVFAKIGITPNQITSLSTLLAISSAAALIYDSGWKLFVLFWSISLLFDFCDGAVARMTNQVRKTAFRYDHTSDLFKIFIVILGVAIRFDDAVLWVASMSASFFFMFYSALSSDLNLARGASNLNSPTKSPVTENNKISKKKSIKEIAKKYIGDGWLRNVYTLTFSINGHTLLLFTIFALGKIASIIFLTYLSIISLISLIKVVINLQSMSKVKI